MPALHFQDLDDFAKATLDKYEYKNWVDISLPYRHLEFAARMVKKKPEAGGLTLKWDVHHRNSQNFTLAGLFHVDQTNIVNTLTQASVQWSIQKTNTSWDYNEEAFQGGDPTQIIDLILLRKHQMYTDFFENMEVLMFSAPNDPQARPYPILGIPWWFQKNASEGFNGGTPSGFSDVAGLSTTTYPRWKNWTFKYTAVSRDDLVEKVIKALKFTKFKPPHSFPKAKEGPPDHVLYTVYSVESQLKKLQEQRNDNMGLDVGWYPGNPTINKVPVVSIPVMEETTSAAYDSQNPVYGINWGQFAWKFQKNNNMRMTGPEKHPLAHDVRRMFLDNAGQFRALDRREAGFVGYYSAS